MLTDPARDQWLRNAAFVYAIAFVVHTGDHLRRGTESTTTHVFVLGTAAAVLQVIALGAELTRHRLAHVFAVAVGFPDALGIAAVHFHPNCAVFSFHARRSRRIRLSGERPGDPEYTAYAYSRGVVSSREVGDRVKVWVHPRNRHRVSIEWSGSPDTEAAATTDHT